MNINDALDKAYESMSLAELVNAPSPRCRA